MSSEHERTEPVREYTVGIQLNDNHFLAEIEPPLLPQANVDELAKVAFLGAEIGVSLQRSSTSYLPYSTVVAGFYEPYDNKTPRDEVQRSVRVGLMKMLSPTFCVDVNVEFLDAEQDS